MFTPDGGPPPQPTSPEELQSLIRRGLDDNRGNPDVQPTFREALRSLGRALARPFRRRRDDNSG